MYRLMRLAVLCSMLLVSGAPAVATDDPVLVSEQAEVVAVGSEQGVVIIRTERPLVPEDINEAADIYVVRIEDGSIALLSGVGDGPSTRATSLSANGRYIVWNDGLSAKLTDLELDVTVEVGLGEMQPIAVSDSAEVVVLMPRGEPFLVAPLSGTTEPIIVSSGVLPVGPAFSIDITRDGQQVLFGHNLAFEQEFYPDTLYLWDRATETSEVVSLAPDGAAYTGVIHQSRFAPDGTSVMFLTDFLLVTRDLITGVTSEGPFDTGAFSATEDGYVYLIRQPPQLGTSAWVVSDRSFETVLPIDHLVGPLGLAIDWLVADNDLIGFSVIDGTDSHVYWATGSPGFLDAYGSIFRTDIEWLDAQGLTSGCNLDNTVFCPRAPVTRGESAALLARALGLAPATVDHFGDDDGHLFEDDINRLAEAGITFGCAPGRYCPDAVMTRGQTAAFLVRGLSLPAADIDAFTDDDGHFFENDIDRLAAAGITKGCGNGAYCPDDRVTRGQLAAFLHRALGG